MSDSNRQSLGTGNASEFYMACREGDLMKMKRLLKTMTHRDINQIEETNRSTALHAASYFGHPQIVKVLLEAGANMHAYNGHGLTPENEARTQEIRDIFKRYKKENN